MRYVLNREEEMLYGCPRGAERHYVKDGVMRDGRIIARKLTSYFDAGAYTRLSSYGAVKCAAHIPGPYTIPNVYADVYCVYTNRTPATAMRGFGITGVDFSLEVQMDKLAHKVGMDPMEFRILNAYRDGDMKAHRREAHNCALIECVQVAAEKAELADPRRVPAHELAYRRRRRARRHSGNRHRRARPHRRRHGHRRQCRRGTSAAPAAQPAAAARTAAGRSPAARAAAGAEPAAAHRRRNARRPPPAPPPASSACRSPTATPQHGATRFSSVFGTRRR